ncbi:MAG: hypothetical protein DI603_08200 [Roseateles depolymerans]|uniref:Lipoprotein n=1 Tax=Roseateles depolymerans TaxID=76731 RepID=A0A2W5DU83_9BURK|nr:MAG: hypothetical protein DI603_08200 [Roseateles depolymerans]
MTQRLAPLALALTASLLCSACVIAPGSNRPDMSDVERMSERAIATCGAGNVKEVNSKSFTCK